MKEIENTKMMKIAFSIVIITIIVGIGFCAYSTISNRAENKVENMIIKKVQY